ncbi:hypothetical protein F4811DRAFT_379017 [Daldinia bambusicola]|nr:hypothetical protein F4811DRAFT_379017 [Daldinia bambusicola]
MLSSFYGYPFPHPLSFKAGLYVVFDCVMRVAMWNSILFFFRVSKLRLRIWSAFFFLRPVLICFCFCFFVFFFLRRPLGVEKYHKVGTTFDDHTVQYTEAISCRPDDFTLLPLLFCTLRPYFLGVVGVQGAGEQAGNRAGTVHVLCVTLCNANR